MPIVVSDTSPIRVLQHLNLLWLLERFYGRVYLPTAVAGELLKSTRLFPPLHVANFPYFVVEDPSDLLRVRTFEQELDAGEAAALVLALEKHATLILIDERAGRHFAKSLGIESMGALGLLLKAKRENLIPALKPCIDTIRRDIEFHLSPALIAEALRLAGE